MPDGAWLVKRCALIGLAPLSAPHDEPRVGTVVVPLRLDGDGRATLARLRRLVSTIGVGWHVVVVDDTPEAAGAARVKAALHAAGGQATYLHHSTTSAAPFSVGRLRDVGVRAASDGPVLFHDVDFFAPAPVYDALARDLQGSLGDTLRELGFLCMPVVFLTRVGTPIVRSCGSSLWQQLDGPAMRRLGVVHRVVRASSAMIVERATLLAHGGHHPDFLGHGAEDFELMHRLSARVGRSERPADYHRDFGSRNAGAGGFRAYFARYAEPLRARGLHLAHAWHPRRNADPRYYAARQRNFAMLEAIMRDADAEDSLTARPGVVHDRW